MPNATTPVLALVTGASGFVGAAIALRFLDLGHSVRLPLRKQEQADAWISEYGNKYPGKIETLLLTKNITEDGAFDEAVKDVDVVVHSASPLAQVKVRFYLSHRSEAALTSIQLDER
jgi:nucleoside-diphosphate-sugar epimerase